MFFLLLACTTGKGPGPGGGDSAGDSGLTPNEVPGDPLFQDPETLLTSSRDRVDSTGADGQGVGSWLLSDLVHPDCDGGDCLTEGVTADDGGLVVDWSLLEGTNRGGLLRLDPEGGTLSLSWRMDGWVYPHEAVREPGTDFYIVADAFLDSVVWVRADQSGSPSEPLATISGLDSAPFDAHTPNGLSVVDDEGVLGLLVSYRSEGSDPEGESGRIVFWDIADRNNISALWAYPAEGSLAAPHNPSLHWRDGRWLLLYAHSHGDAGTGGSVGVAELTDLRTPPHYLADLRPAEGSWRYPRGALLAGDDALFVTDSSAPTDSQETGGGVYPTALPTDLPETGKGGVYSEAGSDQEFVEVEVGPPIITGLDHAYRSLFWVPTW